MGCLQTRTSVRTSRLQLAPSVIGGLPVSLGGHQLHRLCVASAATTTDDAHSIPVGVAFVIANPMAARFCRIPADPPNWSVGGRKIDGIGEARDG